MLQQIALAFFALNALFWGLATHGQHCNLASLFGVKVCPPHWVHLLMGIGFYLIAMYVSQREYLVAIR